MLTPFICDHCFKLLNCLEKYRQRVAEVQQMFANLKQKSNVSTRVLESIRIKMDAKENIHIIFKELADTLAHQTTNQLNDNVDGASLEVSEQSVEIIYENESINEADEIRIEELLENKNWEHEYDARPQPSCQHKTVEIDSYEVETNNAEAAEDTAKTLYKFSCMQCSRKYKLQQHLKIHLRSAHSEQHIHSCQYCSRQYHSLAQLHQHLLQHFACDYCDMKFSSESLLQTHLKLKHLAHGTVICEVCGAQFKMSSTLKTHMLTHSEETPFICQVCNKGFKTRTRLDFHMDIHSNKKWHCNICHMQLNSRRTLARHSVTHSDRMLHKCEHCGKQFKRGAEYKQHLILHAGLKPYVCDLCDKSYANGSNLRSHKKKDHPLECAEQDAQGIRFTECRNVPNIEVLKALTKDASKIRPVFYGNTKNPYNSSTSCKEKGRRKSSLITSQ